MSTPYKFKTGDAVKCVFTAGNKGLSLGFTYIVEGVSPNGYPIIEGHARVKAAFVTVSPASEHTTSLSKKAKVKTSKTTVGGFSVGDEVQFTPHSTDTTNYLGTITSFDKNGQANIKRPAWSALFPKALHISPDNLMHVDLKDFPDNPEWTGKTGTVKKVAKKAAVKKASPKPVLIKEADPELEKLLEEEEMIEAAHTDTWYYPKVYFKKVGGPSLLDKAKKELADMAKSKQTEDPGPLYEKLPFLQIGFKTSDYYDFFFKGMPQNYYFRCIMKDGTVHERVWKKSSEWNYVQVEDTEGNQLQLKYSKILAVWMP